MRITNVEWDKGVVKISIECRGVEGRFCLVTNPNTDEELYSYKVADTDLDLDIVVGLSRDGKGFIQRY